MPKRRPADDRRIYCRPMATDICPGSHRWGACRSSSGHRPKILSSAERIGRIGLPVAASRHPLHDVYDMVQGRENPAMICRCQKVASAKNLAVTVGFIILVTSPLEDHNCSDDNNDKQYMMITVYRNNVYPCMPTLRE